MKKLSKKLSDKYKIESLENIIHEIFWMSRRYAHGRHTFAPSTVRRVYHDIKRICPNIKIEKDDTIKPPTSDMVQGLSFRTYYLDDLDDINE